MKMGIGIGWPNASAGISYVSKLIKAFKARVLSCPNSIFEAEPCLDATLVGLNAIGLLKEASLVITPNAYNEGILYDVVPNTTLGDMDVVRATTATRVNSAGLIEVVPRNLIQQSSTFNVSPWVNSGVTLTSGFTDVNGGNNAFRFQCSATNSYIYNVSSSVIGVSYTHSVYVRAVSGTKNIRIVDAYGQGDLSTQTVTTEWQRLTLTFTTTGNNIGIQIDNNLGTFATDVYICFAQSEQGSIATEYFPTTTRLNIPRIDYTNGSCPSLLVEPQRTNLLTYSEQFDIGVWQKYRGDLGINTQISPSGVQNADTFTSSVGETILPAIVNSSYNWIGNTNYSLSIFVKKIGNANTVTITYLDTLAGYLGGNVVFNLATQTFVINQSLNNSVTASMEDYGDGWYRLVVKFLTVITPSFNYIELTIPTVSTTNTFAIYGAQLEQGSYPTSYIPTVASTVTRNADVISKTGISSLIGQTEGTLFLDLKDAYNGYIGLSDNSDANSVLLAFSKQYSALNFYIYANSADIIGTGFVDLPSSPMKLAFKYKSGEIKLFVNGVLAYSNTSAFTFSSNLSFFGNELYWGGATFEGLINSEQLYKTALTDTECINLTTL